MEGIGNLNSSLGSKVNYLRFGFWSLLAATIAFMCFEILSKKQAEVMAEYYEEQAKELNNQFNPLSINKVEELISASLENSKLPHLDMLIRHVGLQGREERITERKEYIAPRSFNTGSKQQNIEQEIENAWEMGDVATDDKVRTSELNKQYENIYADKLDIVHLDNVLAKVVSLTSSRLFTRGIVLEFDIDEELYVYAEEESLEQVFYHVFTNAFKDLENKPGMKKIKVNVRSLGGSLLISFEDNGLSFSNEFMKQESGLLGLEGKAITVSTELEICRMFMNEFGGSVLFENAFDADNNPVGKKVKLVFKTARKPTDNVVDRDLGENVEAGLSMVRKTTKKDFRAELENKLS